MRLDLGDCEIRDFAAEDVAALLRHANNRNIWANVRDRFPHPYTMADAEAWLEYAAEQNPPTSFCIARRGELVGGIGIELQEDIYRVGAELGYWLGEPFWGRGIATRAVRAFVPYAFARFDLQRIYAHVFATNAASARVLEKAGFQHEGRMRRAIIKDGRVLDLELYALLRRDLRRALG